MFCASFGVLVPQHREEAGDRAVFVAAPPAHGTAHLIPSEIQYSLLSFKYALKAHLFFWSWLIRPYSATFFFFLSALNPQVIRCCINLFIISIILTHGQVRFCPQHRCLNELNQAGSVG